MTTDIEDANDLVRAAVAMRRAGQAAGLPVEEWYDVLRPVTDCRPKETSAEETSQVEWDRLADEPYIEHLLEQQRLKGDGITHEQPVTVAEQTLHRAIEAVRDRHTKYGPPTQHFGRTASLVNAAFGTNFSASDWALVMVLDKVARLRGPTPTTDGGIDIAGYASCYEECRTT
jgi:hypothetical protein